jgi:rSAM/selenodomain-associated transferase 2
MISIITPVLNESENIEPYLDGLSKLEGYFEVIFVDGGSSDNTIKEIENERTNFEHDIRVLTSKRGRGIQMNTGASKAIGDILLFLHVDCSIPSDSLSKIENLIKNGEKDVIGGGFIHSFSDPDTFFRLSSFIGNFQARITKIFFGDFGIFIRKDIFDRMAGYDNICFLEDVEFCRKAKRFGKLEPINSILVSSTRRYYKKGRIKLTVVFIMACMLNIFRIRPGFLYKYIVEM